MFFSILLDPSRNQPTYFILQMQSDEYLPDTYQNPDLSSVDPFGSDGYMCAVCNSELSNVYYHCYACEKFLNKDLNICGECLEQGDIKFDHVTNVSFPPSFSNRMDAYFNHNAAKTFRNYEGKGCPCKQARSRRCGTCDLCSACSCACHTMYIKRLRMWKESELVQLLRDVKNAAGDNGKRDLLVKEVRRLQLRVGGRE